MPYGCIPGSFQVESEGERIFVCRMASGIASGMGELQGVGNYKKGVSAE